MSAWRILASLVVLSSGAVAAQGQTYLLKEGPLHSSYAHLKFHMDFAGELRITEKGKVTPIKQTAAADHDFHERVLDTEGGTRISKVARAYQAARAEITSGSQTSRRTLRQEQRSLIVAQCYDGQALTFCPKGELTCEELELLQHFDTLCLPSLLPGKEVALGDTWKVANAAAQALCGFDGLVSHDLVCKLESVKDNLATISLGGTAAGIELGASVKLKVIATVRFDLEAHRVVAVEWKQQDERDQGPVSPALAATVTVSLERTPEKEWTELNDLILTVVPQERNPAMTRLYYEDAKGRFTLRHARDWHLVARTDQHLVLRLLDQGDFVAQMTLTWWRKAEAGQHMTPEDFKDAMADVPGWEQSDVLKEECREMKTDKGYWAYRLAATGKLNGLETLQYFYLIASPQGEQVVATFTLAPNRTTKLGTRDLDLVHGIVLSETAKAAP
jgi:hypothetical protein